MVKRSRIKRLPAAWEETPVTNYAILPGGMMHIGAASMDEMVEHASGRGTPSEYVRSGIWTPSYSAMTPEVLNYYLHWRDNVRKGRFLKSDMGYIRLFVSELISFNKDPKNDIVLMSRLVSEYKDINILQIGTIGDACICYAVLNKLPLPKVEVLKNRELMLFQTYDALCTEGIGHLSVHNLMDVFDIDADLSKDIPYDALYRRIIFEIESVLGKGDDGYRLKDALRPTRRGLPVFDGLVYNGTRKTFNISYPRDLMTGTVGNILRKALVIMLCGCGCMRAYFESDDDIVSITAMNVTQGYLDGEIKLEDAGFSLDPELIEESQKDLDAVTRMMRVDDEPAEETVPVSVEEISEPITGWEGLSLSLTDVMRGYIVSVMDDDSDVFLKRNGLRRTAIEKEINTLAMDMVGDIILEDGTLIEDYLDEIEEMMDDGRT
jgi:hypothetical protein